MKTRGTSARGASLRLQLRRSFDAADAERQFRMAASRRGLKLPPLLEADGSLHRCPVAGGKPWAQDGAYVLHLDGIPAGYIENFRDGLGPETWRSEPGRRFSRIERAGQRSRVQRVRFDRARETKRRQETAARTAAHKWESAAPAPKGHPYLMAKDVGPHGLKCGRDGRLMAPLRDIDGDLQSLQFIAENGEKRFLKGGRKQGCFLLFGDLDPQGAVLIAEGYATAASLYEAARLPAAAAFDCSNLKAVGQAIRFKHPEIAISFCADDDAWSAGNPGVARAREAAHAVGARLIVPRFADPRPEGATDFNDLLRIEGAAAVHAAIAKGLEGASLPITNADAIEELVGRLARLDPLQYGQQRASAAQRLGVTLADLNKSVAYRKRQLATEAKASGAPAAYAGESAFSDDEFGIYIVKKDEKGIRKQRLANFKARIASDAIHDDGAEPRRFFHIEASVEGNAASFVVPASQFSALNWVSANLGARAWVDAGVLVKDQVRVAIQQLSTGIVQRQVYAHTGWRNIDGAWVYLHAGGAIGKDGALENIEVRLSDKLSHYVLPEPPRGEALAEAVRSSLSLLDLACDRVTVPLVATVYRAVLKACDFATYLAGPTGTFKSELAALGQAHWGPGWRGRNLPGNWASTANSLESAAFLAKDALFVIDDFNPRGSQSQVAAWHDKADRVLRAQGNNSGRGRCHADGSLRAERAPRGAILCSGEDVPAGHSLRARLFIVAVAKGDIDPRSLARAQNLAAKGVFAAAMAGFVRWLAGRYEETLSHYEGDVKALRAHAGASSAHLRTSDIVRSLIASWRIFLSFAEETGALAPVEKAELEARAWHALSDAAGDQDELQGAADPILRYFELLKGALLSGKAHVAAVDHGPPQAAELWGWRKRDDRIAFGWEARGDRIGWLGGEGDLYLEPMAAYLLAEKLAAIEGQALGIGRATLEKRLHERGFLASVEKFTDGKGKSRTRFKVRRRIGAASEQSRQWVLHFKVERVFPSETAF